MGARRVISWRKSAYSGGGTDDACIEVAPVEGRVWVRDSKAPEDDRLAFGRSAFAHLLTRIKREEPGL
jgi:hypothetical protein